MFKELTNESKCDKVWVFTRLIRFQGFIIQILARKGRLASICILWITVDWVNQAAPFGVMAQYLNPTKYFIYARKSSESDEKQVQSIEDQVSALNAFTKAVNLQVVDTLTEARSAKEPQSRPVFETLIKRIKAGEANGIIVWKVDRLARNPIDGATIQWLLQKSILQSIRTPDREYRPEDNVLILNIENSMATQYILDLSKNVKRGMQSKVQKGWRPGRTPLGYLNTKTEISGENYIINDPVRFDIIKKMWELMLSGNYNPIQILFIANNEWGLRTRQSRRSGGAILCKSSIYQIFTNIFYTGIIDNKGAYVQGKHTPMVTLGEFDKVQILLGRKGRPRFRQHDYAYTGLIKCGECGGTVSATTERKLLKQSGIVKEYSLYYCISARKRKYGCSQLHYTNADIINEAIEELLVSLTITPSFQDWVLNTIDDLEKSDTSTENKIVDQLRKTLENVNKQLQNLTQMRMKEMIDDEEFIHQKAQLKNEQIILEQKLTESPNDSEDLIFPSKGTFEFAVNALSKFQTGSPQTKREIVSMITDGSNCTLKDKILNITKAKWIISLEEKLNSYTTEFGAVEPENSVVL